MGTTERKKGSVIPAAHVSGEKGLGDRGVGVTHYGAGGEPDHRVCV